MVTKTPSGTRRTNRLIEFIKKISELIKELQFKGFTGILTLTLYFNNGGIRDAKKNIEDKI